MLCIFTALSLHFGRDNSANVPADVYYYLHVFASILFVYNHLCMVLFMPACIV